jgi:3-deoxy-D-manno-octulosonic-acid transferase
MRRMPDALLLIAPRHPERFRPVEQAARSLGFVVATRQSDRLPELSTQCFVIDTLGELLDFYAAAEVAFVAGSLAPIGGHNVLEPAALAVPVLVGPYTFNFEEITDSLLAAGAARRIADAAGLAPAILDWLGDAPARERAGAAGMAVITQGRGALAATLAPIGQLLREGRCSESTRTPPPVTSTAH